MARILHVIPAFLPATAWGGPVFSASSICRATVAAGHAVTVLTTDSANPETADRLVLDANPARFEDGFDVHYARRSFGQTGSWQLLRAISGMVATADLVHLETTYSFPILPTLVACRAHRKPLIWSPRGAIQATEEWAAAPRKRIKTAFERVARQLAPRDTVLHVTAPSEARATARRMPGFRMEVVPNAVAVPAAPAPRAHRPEGALRLLFLSRLHPKKGREALLASMTALPAHVTLAIAGTGSEIYESALRAQVEHLGLGARVRFLGHVDGAAKARALEQADLFVLPTHAENFGIAVAEALASGLPVITTHGAPWEGLDTHGCGRWIPVDQDALTAALRAFDACTPEALSDMGRKGHAWMQTEFSEQAVGRQMMALYDSLLQGRETP